MANWLNDVQDGFSNLRRTIANPADIGASMRAAQFGGPNTTPADAVANAQPVAQPSQNAPIPAPQAQPPAPVAGNGGGGGVTRAQPPNATFAPSTVAGIYKAVAPDGSITFTDRPGGTFDTNTAQPSPGYRPGSAGRTVTNADGSSFVQGGEAPSGNQYDGAGRRIIGAQPGQLGINRAAGGDFAAGDLTGHSGAKYLYRPQQGAEGTDAGSKLRDAQGNPVTPGTTPWLNANNAPIDPLSSPDAARDFAANKNAISSLRRGDGAFNKTIYDPSGYRASQVPSASGMGGFPPGVNPIDLINAQQRGQHLAAEDAVNAAKFNAGQRQEAEKRAGDVIDRHAQSFPDLPPADARDLGSVSALPEIFAKNPAYLGSDQAKPALDKLAKVFGSMYNPGRIRFGDGPGPQPPPTSGDLADMDVAPDNSFFRNASAKVIGPGYTKNAQTGAYDNIGRADPNNPNHIAYTSAGNNVFGAEHHLGPIGGSGDDSPEADRLFGKDRAGVLRFKPLLDALHLMKYGKNQQKQ